MITYALSRIPAETYPEGITTANLGKPEMALTKTQHLAYCQALSAAGAYGITLPASPAFPDSVFVEDTAVVTKDFAVITRPGAESRREEIACIEPFLRLYFNKIFPITDPGTLDGGDICQADNCFFIGISQRTNPAGAKQLAQMLNQNGYTSIEIDILGRDGLLHLKSGMAYLGENTFLLDERLAAHPAFAAYRTLIVPSDEAYAGNSLRFNDVVFVPASFPKTEAIIRQAGFKTKSLDVSEYRKMDGGLSCLSLRW